jgi:hypothetical protein
VRTGRTLDVTSAPTATGSTPSLLGHDP